MSAGAPALLWLTVSRVCCPGRRGDCLSAQALNCAARLLPFRRPRALHLTATEPARGCSAATGVDSSAHDDASYHTPSPASQRQLPPPLAPQPTPITAAMSSAAWLQGTVAGQAEGPPPRLRAAARQRQQARHAAQQPRRLHKRSLLGGALCGRDLLHTLQALQEEFSAGSLSAEPAVGEERGRHASVTAVDSGLRCHALHQREATMRWLTVHSWR